jgi:hypothetical protein
MIRHAQTLHETYILGISIFYEPQADGLIAALMVVAIV